MPPPTPNEREILVRVAAAGVGPWDALFRERKITVSSPLPLILGSDLSGVVEATGPGVTKFKAGDEVYGMMAYEALKHYSERAMTFRFVSSVDSTDFAEAVFAFTFG